MAWQTLYAQGAKLKVTNSLRQRQENWLQNCLQRNQPCAYLQQLGVKADSSLADFRKRLPLVDDEMLRPWIQRIEQGVPNVLFDGLPLAFEQTSGTSGGSKRIPYTAHSLLDFQHALLPWLSDVIAAFKITSGCAYWAISPATRPATKTPSGIPIGLPDAAYLGEAALHAFIDVSAVPPWVGSIENVPDWSLATLYYLLCRADLVLISVWSPTFFLMLLDTLAQQYAVLSDLLQHGGVIAGQILPPDTAALQRLECYRLNRDTRILWPNLKLVSCWADASSQPYFHALQQRLPHAIFQPKGLLATEGIATVPDPQGKTVLAADSGFFEFLDQQGEACFAWELQQGKEYELVMTTSGGLYRYRTGDGVCCDGYVGDLPVLHFVGRQGLTTDLVGEKLTEPFVTACLHDLVGFRMLMPSTQGQPRYVLILDQKHDIEILAQTVENRLSENPQYDYARRIGQLDALLVLHIEQPLALWIRRKSQNGIRLGDIKVPCLCAETDWLSTFMEQTT
ncbi:MAG: GH3 auxin-responsive promoter family protein [Gallionella sp.]|nr:GH3 auxin-responsive promoter family protein [Gallionella sp.]MDD4958001.1 GH3 auxin-responsive promoter family protein [Gallionella sp.]